MKISNIRIYSLNRLDLLDLSNSGVCTPELGRLESHLGDLHHVDHIIWFTLSPMMSIHRNSGWAPDISNIILRDNHCNTINYNCHEVARLFRAIVLTNFHYDLIYNGILVSIIGYKMSFLLLIAYYYNSLSK